MVYCNNEECENNGNKIEQIGEDSRQEWREKYFECDICHQKKIHRIEYDQLGLVTSDKIITLEDKKT